MQKAPKVFIASMLFVFALASENSAAKNHIFLLPGATLLAPSRFQSPKGFDETVKELKKRIGIKNLLPMNDAINLPHVRSLTLHMTDSIQGITSINIYLNSKTGITEFFLLGSSP